jgi:plastocyanin
MNVYNVIMSRSGIVFYALLIVFLFVPVHMASAENKTITIPLGASNPHFETEAKFWYLPPVVTINSGDTVTWVNSDNEIHTVTSGKGIDRGQFAQGTTSGTPDGYFDSGSFKSKNSWSFTFDKPGTFYYFCTIHPWMNGAIVVNNAIPDSATDAQGNKIEKFPVIQYSQGREVEADMTWEPHVILTGEKVTFIFQFYNPQNSKIISPIEYHYAIIQNGGELFSTNGATQFSGDYKYFVFENPGPVEIKLEKIGNTDLFVSYSTMVFQNPSEVKTDVPIIQPARNILLSQEIQVIFIGPPIALFVFIIIWAKWGDKFRKKNLRKIERKSAI